jgi:hypothetical protein
LEGEVYPSRASYPDFRYSAPKTTIFTLLVTENPNELGVFELKKVLATDLPSFGAFENRILWRHVFEVPQAD